MYYIALHYIKCNKLSYKQLHCAVKPASQHVYVDPTGSAFAFVLVFVFVFVFSYNCTHIALRHLYVSNCHAMHADRFISYHVSVTLLEGHLYLQLYLFLYLHKIAHILNCELLCVKPTRRQVYMRPFCGVVIPPTYSIEMFLLYIFIGLSTKQYIASLLI